MNTTERTAEIEILNDLNVQYTNNKLDVIIPLAGSVIVPLIGGLLCLPLQSVSLFFSGTLGGLILWIGTYLIWGTRIVPAQTIMIIEEFGKYKRQITSGWHILCLPGLIDIIANDSIKTARINLKITQNQETKSDVKIDFECGASAPVKTEVWFNITNALAWHYRAGADPQRWFHDQVSSFLQTVLEKRTLVEAIKSKREIGLLYLETTDHIDNTPLGFDDLSVKEYVENRIGIIWSQTLIIDIKIPQDIQDIRKKSIDAQTERAALSETTQGYTESIKAIQTKAKEMGENISFEQALAIYNRNQDRDAFKKSGANVTVIGDNITNMINSLFKGGVK